MKNLKKRQALLLVIFSFFAHFMVQAQVLHGTYTIGGEDPDYSSWNEAVDALSANGISGPVRLLVRDGNYNEQISIPAISGASAINRISFEAEQGAAAQVVLSYNGNPSAPHTLLINGGDFLDFKNFKIEALNPNHAQAVVLTGAAEYNRFESNTFSGIRTTSSSANYALIYSAGSAQDNHNVFINNTFDRGSYGIYYEAASTRESGLYLEGNTFEGQGYRGIYLRYQNFPVISANHFVQSESNTSYAAIDLYYVNDSMRVTSNTILINNGTGLYYRNCVPASDKKALTANNIISISGTSSATGIYLYYSQYQLLYHNSVYLSGVSNTSGRSAVNLYYSPNNRVLNNIFYNNSGHAINVSNSAPLSSDHNAYYNSNAEAMGSWGGSDRNLAAWRNSGGQDEASVYIDPRFVSATDLHAGEVALYRSGTALSEVSHDMDGEPRHVEHPCIGADEFAPIALDVEALGVVSPGLPFAPGRQPVVIALRNAGADTVKTLKITWKVNNIAQADLNWTGVIRPAETVEIEVGQYEFTPYTLYNIDLECIDPNGSADIVPGNNTTSARNLYPALSGIYTIGGLAPDFETVRIAVEALSAGGIAGPVTFKIRPGSYNEQVSILSFPGSSCERPVIFEPESGDSASVVLTYNSGSGANYVVQLNGADGIQFRKLSFRPTNGTYGIAVDLRSGAHCNVFESCHFSSGSTTTTSTNRALIFISNGVNNNNHFIGNHIEGGSYGMVFNGASTSESSRVIGTIIRGNRILNNYYTGLSLSYQTAPVVENNVIEGVSGYSGYYGIYLSYCYNGLVLSGNDIQSRAGSSVYMAYNYGSASQRGLMANNFISVGGSGNVTGLYSYYDTYLNIYHNNIHVYQGGTGSRAMEVTHGSGAFVSLRNNIFSNTAGGYALYNSAGSLNSDYNNLYTTGTNLAYYSSNRTNLSAWRSAGSWDEHSLSVDPLYASATDLHVNKADLDSAGVAVAEVTTDIDGEERGERPDIGADEFTPSGTNAALVSLLLPERPFAEGVYPIRAVFKNSGTTALTSLNARWYVNGEVREPLSWSGSLDLGQSDTLEIGAVEFKQVIRYDIRLHIESVNGLVDIDQSDDTLRSGAMYTELKGGVYTVGDASSDFLDFSTLATILNSGGISGALTFKIKPGTYTEQFRLNHFAGSSCERPVIFEPESGDSASVVLTYNSGSGANYVVQLNGADGIQFRKLSFRPTNGTYGIAVDLRSGAHCNVFESCHFSSGSTTTTSTNRALIFISNGVNNNNHFIGNHIEGGSYGMVFNGASTSESSRVIGTIIRGNRILNNYYTGLSLSYQTAPVVENNVIEGVSGYSGYYGIYLSYCYNGLVLSGNDIQSRAGSSVYMAYNYGSASQRGLMANNFISVGGSGNVTGLYSYYDTYLNIYHNNIHVYQGGTGSRAMEVTHGSGAFVSLRNNIFSNTAGGYAVYNSAGSLNSDYNNLYTTGTSIGFFSGNRANLSAWQSSGAWDQHSISADPLYTSETDLHVGNVSLNAAGIAVPEVTVDIDGQSRDIHTPDIGADEFGTALADAGLLQVIAPAKPFVAGNHPVLVTLVNNAGNSLQNVTINWEINGQLQPAFEWQGTLDEGKTKAVEIGTADFAINTAYSIRAWVSSPNGLIDESNGNDTIRVDDLYVALKGEYTLGQDPSDTFTSFEETVHNLVMGGVAGPVIFTVASGEYNEQIRIPQIVGSSATNTVSYRSATGDSASVVLTYQSAASASNYTLALDGADYMTFEKMTIRATGTTNAVAVLLQSGARGNQFLNNSIEGYASAGTAAGQSVIYSGADIDSDTRFIGNLIKGGSYGINLSGNSNGYETGVLVQGNEFAGQSYRAILLQYGGQSIIESNRFVAAGSRSDYTAVYLSQCENDTRVLKNHIHLSTGRYGIMLANVQGTASAPGQVVNNFIVLTGSAQVSGIQLSASNYQRVYYNSVHCISGHSGSNALAVSSGGAGNRFVNNIFANSGGGYAVNIGSVGAVEESNYNNLFSTGSQLGYWGSERANLTAWRIASSQDAQSLSVDPLFTADDDLHVRQEALNGAARPVAGITTDIDGDPRHPSTPDIGADEFSGLGNDVGIASVVSPLSGCGYNEPLNVTVAVRNFGSMPQAGFEVAYRVNNGEWEKDTVKVSIGPGASRNFTFSKPVDLSVNGEYRVEVISNLEADQNNANDTLSVIVRSHAAMVTSLNFRDSTVCQGSNLRLVAGGGSSYLWSTGSASAQIQVAPTVNTIYSVRIINANGCVKNDTVRVQVLSLPEKPVISAAGNTALCPGDSMLLTSSIESNIRWSDNLTGASRYVSRTGNYTVRHTNASGCSAVSDVFRVTNPAKPVVEAKPATAVCLGDTVTLQVVNASEWTWEAGAVNQLLKVNPSALTTYRVTMENTAGCTYSDSITINVVPRPRILEHSPDTTICAGNRLTLSAEGLAQRFVWNTGVVSNRLTVSPTVNTTYRVVADNGAGCSMTDTVFIQVNVIPAPAAPVISYSGSPNLCFGDSVRLSSDWSENIVWSEGSQASSIWVSEKGNYTVTYRDARGCESVSAPVSIQIENKPSVQAVGSRTLCRGDEAELRAVNAQSVVWSTGAVSSAIRVSPVDTTIYYADLRSSLGCSFRDSLTISVIDPVPPMVVSDVVPANQTLNLTQPFSISWRPGGNSGLYDLYIWPDTAERPANPRVANTSSIRHEIKDLDYGKNYSWQVVSKNSCYSTESPVYAFHVRELPDLIVENVQIPVIAYSAGDLSVNWDVRNIGKGSTISENWDETVYLSLDTLYDSNDIKLGTVKRLNFLVPGQGYTNYGTFKLPKTVFGDYYVLIRVERPVNGLIESSTTNNIGYAYPLHVSIPATPDLQIVSVAAPAVVFGGDTITVTYGVKNIGNAEAKGKKVTDRTSQSGMTCPNLEHTVWKDELSIGQDPVYSPGTVHVLEDKTIGFRKERFSSDRCYLPGGNAAAVSTQWYNTPDYFSPDSVYYKTFRVKIPHDFYGDYYLHVRTDADRDIDNELFTSNNRSEPKAIQVYLNPPPNLVVKAVSMPAEMQSGQTVPVRWTVRNDGANAPVENAWIDRIYISRLDTFNQQASVEIGYKVRTGGSSFKSGDTYSEELNLKIPDGISGQFYLYVYADASRQVFEYTYEKDNILRGAEPSVIRLAAYPDLVIRNIEHIPQEVTQGDTLSLSWLSYNAGDTIIAQAWSDSYGLVRDTNQARLSTFARHFSAVDSVLISNPAGLGARSGYTNDSKLPLPLHIHGTYYLRINSDNTRKVYEHDKEENNLSHKAIHIRPVYSDLAISCSNVPAVMYAGDQLMIDFQVRNIGEGFTGTLLWEDRLVLSKDSVYSADDVSLHSSRRNGILYPASGYSGQFRINLANTLSGTYYLIARTGSYLNPSTRKVEILPVNDTAQKNNYYAVPVEIRIPETPDLVIDSIIVPDVVLAGERVQATLVIRNAGVATAVSGWSFKTELAANPNGAVLNGLTGSRVLQTIAPGATINTTVSITIPANLTGNYYLRAVADYLNSVFEYNGEDNNSYAKLIRINPVEASDLVVRQVVIPEKTIPGKEITVSYQLHNQGSGRAVGQIRDDAYFSKDQSLIETNDYLLRARDHYLDLKPGESVSREITYQMPGVMPGDYFGMARTNTTHSIPETNLGNNTGVSESTVSASIPVIHTGEPVKSPLDYRERLYYQVEVGENLDMIVYLKSNRSSGNNQIYIAYDRVPGPDDYDYIYKDEGVPNQTILIPETKAGTYYLLITTPESYYGQQEITLLAEALPFSILNARASVLGQGVVSNEVQGAGFRTGIVLYLEHPVTKALVADAVVTSFRSSMELGLRWNLSNTEEGVYNLVARNANGEIVRLEAGIQVEKPTSPEVVYGTIAPASLRVGTVGTWKFTLKSVANVDIPYLEVALYAPAEDQVQRFRTSPNLKKMSDRYPEEYRDQVEIDDFSEYYMTGGEDLDIGNLQVAELLARDVKPGEILEAEISIRATRYSSYPVGYLKVRPLTRKQFIENELDVIEETRKGALLQPQFADASNLVLLNDSAAFATTMLRNNYIETGLLDEEGLEGRYDFSPGNSPGTAEYPSIVFHGNGNYLWEINDANGQAGNDPGWDLLRTTNTLVINANAGRPFTIKITSLNPDNAAGSVANWDPMRAHNWPIAIADKGITGFNVAAFTLDLSDFRQHNSVFGDFNLELSGANTLMLSYVPLEDADGDGTPNVLDKCPLDPKKIEPGICGCGKDDDADADGDGTPDCLDKCPADPNKTEPGDCGCGVADTDSDGDGVADCKDRCPDDPAKTAPGACGCGVADADTDGDGTPDCRDRCPNDPNKTEPGACGCGVADKDSDGDGVPDCKDGCPRNPSKTTPGICGCDSMDADSDGDGVVDCLDACPTDRNKVSPGICGCNVADTDSDGDGVYDCQPDACPTDPAKTDPGICGCGVPDIDSDGDGTPDCIDPCPFDPNKTQPGICGCGTPDTDSDGDGVADCYDQCPDDPNKTEPGSCGCGTPDKDSDGDGTPDCFDNCPENSGKTEPGVCGCDTPDNDSDGDGTLDCNDGCPSDPNKTDPGQCGCGVEDKDTDGDGTPDCQDRCPYDPQKTEPGKCGCYLPDDDSDGDGTPDYCLDKCPNDPEKTSEGACGCGNPDEDSDGDGTPDCNDQCPNDPKKIFRGYCGCNKTEVECLERCGSPIPTPNCGGGPGMGNCCTITNVACKLLVGRKMCQKRCLGVALACMLRVPPGPWTAVAGGACAAACWYACDQGRMDLACDAVSDVICVPVYASCDPNEILGPIGYGEAAWVGKHEQLPYVIFFENDPELATAPAQRVEITQKLDSLVNPLSLRLGSFGFGPYVFEVPDNVANYTATLDLTDSLGILLQITAGVDIVREEAFWLLQSIDPLTGLPPQDPMKGFLAINDSTGIGQGYVSYSILPDAGVVTGDVIQAEASIVFDDNAAIITNTWINTIDADHPLSWLEDLPAMTYDTTFTVSWSGSDVGSGIAAYQLFVSENGGPFVVHYSDSLAGTDYVSATSIEFAGKRGGTYAFYTQAIDSTGNIEPLKTSAQEVHIVNENNTAPMFTLSDSEISGDEDFEETVVVYVIPGEIPEAEREQVVRYSIEPEVSDLVNIVFDNHTGELQISSVKDRFGVQEFVIIADDGQAFNNLHSESLTVTVLPVNDAPEYAGELADQWLTVDEAFSFTIPSGTFTDADPDDLLTYTLSMEDGSGLPAWLVFDPAGPTLSGMPEEARALVLRMTATDVSGTSASGTFTLTVTDGSVQAILYAEATAICEGVEVSFQVQPAREMTEPVYTWFINDRIVEGAADALFTTSGIREGDRVSALVSEAANPLRAGKTEVVMMTVYENPVPEVSVDGLVLAASEAESYQWYLNSLPLEYYQQAITVTEDGIYQVEVSDSNGCTGKSENVEMLITGLSDQMSDFGIGVYPNPNNGLFRIDLGENASDRISVRIVDVKGVTIYTTTYRGDHGQLLEMDIRSAPSGVYWMVINLNGKNYARKIRKE